MSSNRPPHARASVRTPVVRDDPLLPSTLAGPYLGLAPKTLDNWRLTRDPSRTIPYLKLGGRILYRQSALDDFLRRCERESG